MADNEPERILTQAERAAYSTLQMQAEWFGGYFMRQSAKIVGKKCPHEWAVLLRFGEERPTTEQCLYCAAKRPIVY